jgi:hypothetical protein
MLNNIIIESDKGVNVNVDLESYEKNIIDFNKLKKSNIKKFNILNEINNDSDWILNMEDQFIRKVNIGKFALCEIPKDCNIETLIKLCKNNIFLETKYKQILWLKNKKTFKIECENVIRDSWLCKIITFSDFLELSSLKNIITEKEIEYYQNKDLEIEITPVIYGRCNCSMTFLDKVYRDYVYKHKFNKNDILAIKSVAGSGKTTTLLELSKIHKKKKILYIAFNKSLIEEIKEKLVKKEIKNLYPVTFDALSRMIFMNNMIKNNVYDDENIDNDILNIIDLKPQTLPYIMEWFVNKPYRIKNYYISNFRKFCNQTKYSCIKEYSIKVLGIEKNLLINMWKKVLNYELITFDSIRKMVEINHMCKDYIDKNYDMIFIDESQDFDNTMLKILLEDTTIPKIFVGDTKQAIYEWKGSINAFDKLPKSTLTLEFYSTFRIGNPACNEISSKFDSCWMISKSNNNTILEYNSIPNKKYVYLFRSWKNLLKSAQNIKNIWIYNYESQIEYIKKLHSRLQISKLDEDELNEFSDDLPKFLLKMSFEELDKLLNNIKINLVDKNICNVEFYTIHSYKGLENDIIRIFNDIDIKKEQNLYYVALTRGIKRIILDVAIPEYDDLSSNKKQISILDFGIKI